MPYTKGNQPWNKGLTKEDPRIGVAAKKASATMKERGTGWSGRKHSDATKQRMSDSKKKLYESGFEPVCGRAKKYTYFSPVAGEIKVDGTWELVACKYLDFLGVRWIRNRKRFKYVKDDKERTYQPDFYIFEWDTYIEVKGYQTDLDTSKWTQFPHKIEVWKKDKIKSIESELGGA